MAAALGSLFALTGCTGEEDKGDDVQTVFHAEAKRRAAAHAEQTAASMGEDVTLQPSSEANPVPCDGQPDGVYHVQGAYQVLLPGEQHLDRLRRLRESWQQAGYEIRGERTFPDGVGGEVSAYISQDEFSITVSSGQPPAIAILVASPCYYSAEPI